MAHEEWVLIPMSQREIFLVIKCATNIEILSEATKFRYHPHKVMPDHFSLQSTHCTKKTQIEMSSKHPPAKCQSAFPEWLIVHRKESPMLHNSLEFQHQPLSHRSHLPSPIDTTHATTKWDLSIAPTWRSNHPDNRRPCSTLVFGYHG